MHATCAVSYSFKRPEEVVALAPRKEDCRAHHARKQRGFVQKSCATRS